MSTALEKTVVTSCTNDCPDGCGILATVRDGRLESLRGNPDHPVTRGFLCRRAQDFIRRVYSPSRVTTPMLRANGGWKPVSWEDALDLVAEKLAGYRDRDGGLSIHHYQDNGSTAALKILNGRFFNLFGGVTTASGSLCGGAGIAGQTLDFGYRTAHEPMDIPNSRLILIWGRNPVVTNVHMVPFLREARATGATLVLIDPLRTRTAELCDLHYRPLPGSDGFLAAALGKILLKENLADRDFVERHTEGFPEYRRLLDGLSLDWLAERCGMPVPEVRKLALLYGGTKPAAIWGGWGLQRREFGAEIYRLVDALGALTGNIGVPGGGVSHGMDEREYWDWGLLAREAASVRRAFPKPTLGEEILRAEDPPIKMIVVTAGNPVNQSPHSLKVQEAFRRAEFVVCIDSFLTDTADVSHLFLPTTTFLEEDDLVGAFSHQWLQPVNPAIEPVGEARCDLAIFQDLATRMGIEGMDGSPTEWQRRLAAPLERLGITLERLKEGPVRHPTAPAVPFADWVFPTPSGRFRFTGELPENPSESRRSGYVLISSHPDTSVHSQLLPEDQGEPPEVRMNPADAADLGLSEGEEILLSAGEGRLKGRLRLDADLARGVLHCFEGGWIKYGAGVNLVTRDILTRHGLCAGFYEAVVEVRGN